MKGIMMTATASQSKCKLPLKKVKDTPAYEVHFCKKCEKKELIMKYRDKNIARMSQFFNSTAYYTRRVYM